MIKKIQVPEAKGAIAETNQIKIKLNSMKLMERLQQSIRLAALLHNMDESAFFLCPSSHHALAGIFFADSRIPYETDRSAPVSALFLPRQTGAAPSQGELVIV